MKKMSIITLVLAIGFFSTNAFAGSKECTKEPKEKWMKEEDFKKKVEADGYSIKKFKTPGTCYEIYGHNKEGKKVEIYFNPVNASIVKSEIEK